MKSIFNSSKRFFAFITMISVFLVSTVSCTVLDKLADLNFYGNLSEKAEWLQGLSADSIVKIDIKNSSHSVAPGRTDSCYYTENKEVIARIIEIYQNMKIKMDTSGRVYGMIGGGSRSITFTFADGHTEELFFLHGYYKSGILVYDIVYGDNKDYYNDCERYWRFANCSSESEVYSNTDEPALIGKATGIETWEFVIIDIPVETDSLEEAMFYVDTSFGKIYALSETRFCVDQMGELSYYELTNGQTFGDFITFTTETK